MPHFRPLLLLLLLAPGAQAAESDANQALRDARVCAGHDPLSAVQALAAQGSTHFDDGYAGYEIGEEIDTKSIVLLRTPIAIAGATTHAVVAGPAPAYEAFEALIHARFIGDWHPVAAELKLASQAGSDVLQRATEPESDDVACPPTIQLKPLDDGGFLLGCGWCNG